MSDPSELGQATVFAVSVRTRRTKAISSARGQELMRVRISDAYLPWSFLDLFVRNSKGRPGFEATNIDDWSKNWKSTEPVAFPSPYLLTMFRSGKSCS